MQKSAGLLVLWFIVSAGAAFAAGHTADVTLRGPEDRRLLKRLDVSVESVTGGVARVWLDDREDAALRAAGLPVRLTTDGALSRGARGYHTPEQCVADFQAWAAAHPEVCRLTEIGKSVEGRPILSLKITTDPDQHGFKPAVRICGAHHGNEVMSCETVILFTKYLLDNYKTDAKLGGLVRDREIHIIPMVNPDGVSKLTRHNANDVDLNRNYGYNWAGGTKSGEVPYSEPEVRAIRDHAMQHAFSSSLSFHCSGNIINTVWNYTPVRVPDNEVIQEISQGYAAFNQYSVTVGWDWYETHGDTDDFSYGCRGDLDWTIEVENPDDSGIAAVFAKNRDAIVYFLEQAGRGICGTVTDAATGKPLEAMVEPMPTGWPCFTDPAGGDFHRVIKPGTYALRVWAPGHEAKVVENVVVPASGAVRVDVALAAAPEYHALNVATTVIPNEDDYHNKTHAPHALGPADGRFVSLAKGGYIVLDLGAAFPAGKPGTVSVTEATCDTPESCAVATSTDLAGPWTDLGTVRGTGAVPAAVVQRYLRIADSPTRVPSEGDPTTTPGYDLDAVTVVPSAR